MAKKRAFVSFASLDDVAVVGKAIEQCGRHFGIAEDAGPFTEGEIGGDDDRGVARNRYGGRGLPGAGRAEKCPRCIYVCALSGSNGPGSEKPSIDSTFALFSAMLSGVRCGS
jgi:hypothetical protein